MNAEPRQRDVAALLYSESTQLEVQTMKAKMLASVIALSCLAIFIAAAQESKPFQQLRVMVIGAHPDDADKAGGTAAKYIALGHKVMLVALTNGDAGHFEMGGGPLAKRRTEEA